MVGKKKGGEEGGGALEEAKTPLFDRTRAMEGNPSGSVSDADRGAGPPADTGGGGGGGVTAATEAEYRTSVLSLCAVHLILSTDFFIVQPTLYTYLHEVFGEDRAFQGYTMGAFFAAQALFGPVFGYVSDRVPVRIVLSAAMCVCAAGNLMYALATSKWMLLAGRVVAGASAAVDAVTYGYIAQVSQRKNLTRSMATLRAYFALGQVLAPLASLLISVSKVDTKIGALHIDVYTLPSIVTAVACGAYATAVWISVRELPSKARPRGAGARDDSAAARAPAPPRATRDVLIALAILACMFGLIFLMGAVSAFNVPLTSNYYSWGSTRNSAMLVGVGVVNIGTVHVTRHLLREHPGTDEKKYLVGFTVATVASTALFLVAPGSDHVQQWRYITAYVLSSAAFTVAATMAYGVYSKVNSGPSSSGFMSWLPATGSLGRVLGPTFAGAAKVPGQEGNPNFGVLGGAGVCLVGLGLFIAAYRAVARKAHTTAGRSDGPGGAGGGSLIAGVRGDDDDDDDEKASVLAETASLMDEDDLYRSGSAYVPPTRLASSQRSANNGKGGNRV